MVKPERPREAGKAPRHTHLDRRKEVLQREAHELVASAISTIGELVAKDNETLLVRGQPSVRLFRVPLDPIESKGAQADRDEAFEHVDPAPAAVSPMPIKLADAVGK